MEKVWGLYPSQLDELSSHKFRQAQDASHLLHTIQDIADGAYVPMINTYYGPLFFNLPERLDEILTEILQGQSKIIVLNDSEVVTPKNFERLKNAINGTFERKFPQKSAFER